MLSGFVLIFNVPSNTINIYEFKKLSNLHIVITSMDFFLKLNIILCKSF